MEKIDSVKKFLLKKNEILREYLETDIDLTPTSQIVEVPLTEKLDASSSYGMCPYCVLFRGNSNDSCGECPMHLAGNSCLELPLCDTSFGHISILIVIKTLNRDSGIEDVPLISELVDNFNENYNFNKNDK